MSLIRLLLDCCVNLRLRATFRVCSRGEHRTRFFVLSCFLPWSWRAAGQDKNQKRVLSYRTGHQDTRTACLVLSSDEHFCPVLSCFVPSSWRAAGQDKNKKRVPSYRTGHQDRLSCAQLWYGHPHPCCSIVALV